MATFKIGDKVEFVGGVTDHIPGFYADCPPENIPVEKLIHGTTTLGDQYKAEKAVIVDTHNEYLIVKWTSSVNKEMRLGFLPESLKLISNSLTLSFMSTVVEKLKMLLKGEPQKTFQKVGIFDKDDLPDNDTVRLYVSRLMVKDAEFVAEATKLLAEQEAKK